MNTDFSIENTHTRLTGKALDQILTQVNDQYGEALGKLAKGPDDTDDEVNC